MNTKETYRMELEAELAKLKEDQEKFFTEYKAERIKQVSSRLDSMGSQ